MFKCLKHLNRVVPLCSRVCPQWQYLLTFTVIISSYGSMSETCQLSSSSLYWRVSTVTIPTDIYCNNIDIWFNFWNTLSSNSSMYVFSLNKHYFLYVSSMMVCVYSYATGNMLYFVGILPINFHMTSFYNQFQILNKRYYANRILYVGALLRLRITSQSS